MPQSWLEQYGTKISTPTTGGSWLERNGSPASVPSTRRRPVPTINTAPKRKEATWGDTAVTGALRMGVPIAGGLATGLLTANPFPGFGKAPGVGAGVKEIAKYALTKGGAQGATIGAGSRLAKSMIDEGHLPTVGELGESAATGYGFGALGTGAVHYGLDRAGLLGRKPAPIEQPKVTETVVPPVIKAPPVQPVVKPTRVRTPRAKKTEIASPEFETKPSQPNALPNIESLPKVDTSVVTEPKLIRKPIVPDVAPVAAATESLPPVAPVAPFGASKPIIKEAAPAAPPVPPVVRQEVTPPVVKPVAPPVVRREPLPVSTPAKFETLGQMAEALPKNTGNLELDNLSFRLKHAVRTALKGGLSEEEGHEFQFLNNEFQQHPNVPPELKAEWNRLVALEDIKVQQKPAKVAKVKVKKEEAAPELAKPEAPPKAPEPVKAPEPPKPLFSKPAASETEVINAIPKTGDIDFDAKASRLKILEGRKAKLGLSEAEQADYDRLTGAVRGHAKLPEEVASEWNKFGAAPVKEVVAPDTRLADIKAKAEAAAKVEPTVPPVDQTVVPEGAVQTLPPIEQPSAVPEPPPVAPVVKEKKPPKGTNIVKAADHASSGNWIVELDSGNKVAVFDGGDGKWYVDAAAHGRSSLPFAEMESKTKEGLAKAIQARDAEGTLGKVKVRKSKMAKDVVPDELPPVEPVAGSEKVEPPPVVEEPTSLSGKNLGRLVDDIDTAFEGATLPTNNAMASMKNEAERVIAGETNLDSLADNLSALETAQAAAAKQGNKAKAGFLENLRQKARDRVAEETKKLLEGEDLDESDFAPKLSKKRDEARLLEAASGNKVEERGLLEAAKKRGIPPEDIKEALKRFKEIHEARSVAQQNFDSLTQTKVAGVKRKVFVVDSEGKFTQEDIDRIKEHPLMHDIIRHYSGVIDDILASSHIPAKWSKQLEGIGLVFDPQLHGSTIYNPRTNKVTILINPFSGMEPGASPFDAAFRSVTTNMHELAHVNEDIIKNIVDVRPDFENDFVSRYYGELVQDVHDITEGYTPEQILENQHGKDFVERLGIIYDSYGAENAYKATRSLERVFTGGGSSREYSPEVQKLLHFYQNSRGRTATKENFFIREGAKSEVKRGREGEVPLRGQPSGEGASPELEPKKKPIVETVLPKELLPEGEAPAPKEPRKKKVKAAVDEAVKANPVLKKPGIWEKVQALPDNFRQSSFYKSIYEPLGVSAITKLERMGPGGQALAKLLRDERTESNRFGGEFATVVRQVGNSLSKTERTEVIKILDGQKELSKASSEKVADAYHSLRGVTERIGDAAIEAGVMMKDEAGKTVPFEKFMGEYFPHIWEEGHFASPNTLRSKLLRSGKDAEGNPLSPAAVEAIMKNVTEKGERFSSPQQARKIDMEGYVEDLSALEKHVYDLGRTITRTKRFGVMDVSNAESAISQAIKDAENPTKAARIVNDYLNRTEIGDMTAQRKIYDKVVKAEVLSKLSQFSITNLGDFASLTTNLGLKNTVKAIAEVIANPHGSVDISTGAGAQAILRGEILNEVAAGGLLKRGWKTLLDKPLGAATTEKFIRTVGTIAAKAETKRLFALAKANPAKYSKQLQRFVDGDVADVLRQASLTSQQMDFAGGRGVELSSGFPDKLTLSKGFHADNPLLRLPLLFKRFAFVNTQNMVGAVKAESTMAGKIAKATAIMAAYQVAGEAVGDMKSAIRGLVNGDIGKALEERGDYIGTGNPVFDRVMANYLQSALFGIVGDVSESVVRKNYGKVSGTIGGPVLSDLDELSTGLGDVFDKPTDRGRFDSLTRTGARAVPLVGTGLGDLFKPKKKNKFAMSLKMGGDMNMGF